MNAQRRCWWSVWSTPANSAVLFLQPNMFWLDFSWASTTLGRKLSSSWICRSSSWLRRRILPQQWVPLLAPVVWSPFYTKPTNACNMSRLSLALPDMQLLLNDLTGCVGNVYTGSLFPKPICAEAYIKLIENWHVVALHCKLKLHLFPKACAVLQIWTEMWRTEEPVIAHLGMLTQMSLDLTGDPNLKNWRLSQK